ncbi:MBL fold metallo-hydrolase [Leifsonia sp. NPDC077715]|uniref:MBL fold metallo-hydrolase n=1 Tax=Leifsonia sp. NPDC077715 TaxID=3155539 RepID=UPI00342CC63F
MSITVTPVHIGDLAGVDLPVYIHVIDHPGGRILVDTGLTALHSMVEDMDPRLKPVGEWGLDPASVDAVVNTHLHFDHAGGNHLFAGTPIHVQRQELEDGRHAEDYTIREWVDPEGVELQYVPEDGEVVLAPGIRLMPAPGHTRGSQIVVVETDEGLVVIAGDSAVWGAELDDPQTEGQRLIRALEPTAVWMSHAAEPWRPSTS